VTWIIKGLDLVAAVIGFVSATLFVIAMAITMAILATGKIIGPPPMLFAALCGMFFAIGVFAVGRFASFIFTGKSGL
jgi:hypothetical protein